MSRVIYDEKNWIECSRFKKCCYSDKACNDFYSYKTNVLCFKCVIARGPQGVEN